MKYFFCKSMVLDEGAQLRSKSTIFLQLLFTSLCNKLLSNKLLDDSGSFADHKEITQFILIKNEISFISVAFTNRHQQNLRGDLRDSSRGLCNWRNCLKQLSIHLSLYRFNVDPSSFGVWRLVDSWRSFTFVGQLRSLCQTPVFYGQLQFAWAPAQFFGIFQYNIPHWPGNRTHYSLHMPRVLIAYDYEPRLCTLRHLFGTWR